MSSIVVSKSSVIAVGSGIALGVIIGVLIGHFSAASTEEDPVVKAFIADQWIDDWDGDRSPQSLVKMISTDNIETNLKELTSAPHLAGSSRDVQLAELLKKHFQDVGFDNVEMPGRNFLLSRPDPNNPNLIRVRDGRNNTVFTTNYKEQPLHPGDEHSEFIHAFNAYSPKGDVWSASGEGAVYVNYGLIEDFEHLQKLGVSVKGRIAIMRYGKIFRGNKISHAAQFGAVGAILYSDPQEVAQLGQEDKDVYPYNIWLPGTGIQRGTTYLSSGDPLTPGWPSTDYAYRIDKKNADFVRIPAQPIGYADAKQILSKLAGPRAPDEWQGAIAGIEYHLGPQFKPEYADHRLQLTSNNVEEQKLSYNVIATIKGSVEPDRYVLIGNHRDAWGFGASDPSSGTAQLMETARVFGELVHKGWRPRRTIIFCSWGAEEYGLIGSTEWVEEHAYKLQGRSVAYINTDTCASGPSIQLRASPLLWDVLQKITALVPGVQDDSKTLLHEWTENDKLRFPNETKYPVLKTLGSGSDYAAFAFYAGIPALDVWFRQNQAKAKGTYASYHTGYETFFMISNNTDPGFRAIQGCSRFALLTMKLLADSKIIPYSLSRFPHAMKAALNDIAKDGKQQKLVAIYDKYPFLEDAIDNLILATENFEQNIKDENMNPLAVRAINDQMLSFERSFLLSNGLPNRTIIKHAIFAPSKFNSYGSSGFPGIVDLLHGYDEISDLEERQRRDEQIRRHISDLTIAINRARGVIHELHLFEQPS